jgi:outer membrane protein TolC
VELEVEPYACPKIGISRMNRVAQASCRGWARGWAVAQVLLAVGCLGRPALPARSFEFSAEQVSAHFVDGFHDTFGPEGAFPLLGPREEAELELPTSDPLDSMGQLTLPGYLGEVAMRHPSVEAAEAAIEGAEELYPQAIAFANPQFRFLNGPTLFGSASGAHLWRLQAQQPFDAWGKRGARGRMALEKAATAREEASLVKERLRKTAVQVYFDYALSEALRPLAEAELRAAEEEFERKLVHLAADEAPSVGQSEQWQLDRLELEQRIDEFQWSCQEAARRMNLLLGRDAAAPLPLPAPPPLLNLEAWDEEALVAAIMVEHPALARAMSRCRESEASIELARTGYYPDFVLVARFDTNADSFWLPESAFIRPQLGINVFVPVHRERVAASVRQAEAELRQRAAERQLVERQIRQEIVESLNELQRLHHNGQRLAALAAVAQRKANVLAQVPPEQFTVSIDSWHARRQWLKYETERVKAEFAWRQKICELMGHLVAEPPPVPADAQVDDESSWPDRPHDRPWFPPPELPASAQTETSARPAPTLPPANVYGEASL